MEKDMKKAIRRKAEFILKAKALKQLEPRLNSPHQPLRPIDVERTVGKMAHTKTACSCPMCGNPRKFQKGANRETLAEHKARLKEVE